MWATVDKKPASDLHERAGVHIPTDNATTRVSEVPSSNSGHDADPEGSAFLAAVVPTPTCWTWPGDDPRGAQRFAFKRWAGDLPAGFVASPACGVARCVKPWHLEAVPACDLKAAHQLGRVNGPRWDR